MYCGNCGKEIKEGSAFCPACGAKVVIVKTGRENSKKKNRKKNFYPGFVNYYNCDYRD